MAANPSDPPQHYYSLDEYFALEHTGDARYEYWDGDIVCMSGGSLAHARIAGNIYHRLAQKLSGGKCVPFTADLAVKTPTLLPYRYPDLSVACGEPAVENVRGVDALLNPVLIAEVLSPSTEKHDRGDKFAAYQQIPDFQEYLLVAQHAPSIVRYCRQPDGTWVPEEISGLNAVVHLTSVDCELSLAEVYQGVVFTL